MRQYYYNENQQIIKLEEQDWYDISINVIPIFRTYEYDSLGLLSVINRFRWSDDLNDYYLVGRFDYSYNNMQQIEEAVSKGFYLDGNSLTGDSILFIYNERELLKKQTNFSYKLDEGLELFEEYTYRYNDEMKLIEKIKYENF